MILLNQSLYNLTSTLPGLSTANVSSIETFSDVNSTIFLDNSGLNNITTPLPKGIPTTTKYAYSERNSDSQFESWLAFMITLPVFMIVSSIGFCYINNRSSLDDGTTDDIAVDEEQRSERQSNASLNSESVPPASLASSISSTKKKSSSIRNKPGESKTEANKDTELKPETKAEHEKTDKQDKPDSK
uniref:Uncharacterized protein n=1 Tax=Tetranychus urticae TaxID=32264 RepID=T1K221_TETUR